MPREVSKTLETALLKILKAYPSGISEYDLIGLLRQAGFEAFAEDQFRDNLNLFRCHFLLFHNLYKLQQRLWEQQQAYLEISPLKIILLPFPNLPSASKQLDEHNPLREYYLDVSQLDTTTGEDVDQILLSFWARLQGAERRQQALEVLGLEDPVDNSQIKKTYRQLAMQHHPDRGGDKARLQTINAAMAALQQ